MALKEIANGDATVKITSTAVTGSVAVQSGQESNKLKLSGKGALRGQINVDISGLTDTSTSCIQTAPLDVGTIDPTAQKVTHKFTKAGGYTTSLHIADAFAITGSAIVSSEI